LEVISSAFVVPAAILIVEAFVFCFLFCVMKLVFCVGCCHWFWSAAASLRCCYWVVFERSALSFSSQVMCFDLERAVLAFVLNVGGCFDT
jgi:hypothetical protein